MIYCGVLLTGRDLGQGHVWGVIRPREPSQQFPLARAVHLPSGKNVSREDFLTIYLIMVM